LDRAIDGLRKTGMPEEWAVAVRAKAALVEWHGFWTGR
jgi:hypothetical protein